MHRYTTLFAMLATSALSAQTTAPMLVDVDWLATHLNDRNLVLLHVGPKDAYDTSHIPGARHITLDDIARPRDP